MVPLELARGPIGALLSASHLNHKENRRGQAKGNKITPYGSSDPIEKRRDS